jgi:hypothetical protein
VTVDRPYGPDLMRLWHVTLADAVQPLPVGPVTGLDEKLLFLYRGLPSRAVGQRVMPLMSQARAGRMPYDSLQQLGRMGGVALWECEFETGGGLSQI